MSRATVSRVMNGRSTVDPEISARVREAAASLSYRPSNVARNLALGRTNTVAVVVPDLGNPVFQQILRGVASSAAEDGYRVLVAETAEDESQEAAIALEARLRCDALVLVSPRMPDTELAGLVGEAEPIVLVNREIGAAPGGAPVAPCLVVDYADATLQVVSHLVGLGHRRVVYLAGPRASASDGQRRAGLARAQELHPDLRLEVLPAGPDIAAGHAVTPAVLAGRFTAAVAYNDLVAFGLLAGLNEAGVAVPGDISVAGFDDIDLARYATPALTTAAVPQTDLGRHAWRELHAVITEGAEPAVTARFAARLQIRASTGPLPRLPERVHLADDGRDADTAPAPSPTAVGSNTSGTGAGSTTDIQPTATGGPVDDSVAATARTAQDRTDDQTEGVSRAGGAGAPVWAADGEAMVLRAGPDGAPLARREPGDRVPRIHAPRPYLHPVHTLAGVALTDAGPVDHRHHYGVSIALPDVNGTSHWGGRTFLRDVGPTLLENHGTQVATALRVAPDDTATLVEDVLWSDEQGNPQLTEERRLGGRLLPGVLPELAPDALWVLSWDSTLHASHGSLEIRSPATNGRPGAGYGGLFWRLPAADRTRVLSAAGEGESAAHGSSSPWVAFTQQHAAGPATLVLAQPGVVRPWFLRSAEYPGACPALAWDAPLFVPDGGSVQVRLVAALVDAELTLDQAATVAEALL